MKSKNSKRVIDKPFVWVSCGFNGVTAFIIAELLFLLFGEISIIVVVSGDPI